MSSPKCVKCLKEATMRCSKCRSAIYCSQDCQKRDWSSHKVVCFPECIVGVEIFCQGDPRGTFGTVNIGPSHGIHRFGVPCPVSSLIGLPLVFYRHIREDPFSIPRTAALDNQIATYLIIDPISGFAPPEWQQCVGTIVMRPSQVTIMRKDGKPLTKAAAETIWMYHDRIIDLFGDDTSFAHAIMNQADFRRFCESYKEEKLSMDDVYRDDTFEDMSLPL